jgi:hypothetical protein
MELNTLRLWLYTLMKVRAERWMRFDRAATHTKH